MVGFDFYDTMLQQITNNVKRMRQQDNRKENKMKKNIREKSQKGMHYACRVIHTHTNTGQTKENKKETN